MRAPSPAASTLAAILTAGLLWWSPPAWADGREPIPPESLTSDPVDVFYTGGDDVHFSSTPPPTVSAHGWWIDENSGDAKAKVTVKLQVKERNGSWRTVTTGTKTVKQGGGSARRANARKTCVGTASTTWRSEVDVDIIGVADSPDKLVTPVRTYACGAD
ncbi:hypothetical protein [Streptomyces acidiscabies]|uniref:hypothetical protein n=1 Tax=Streptomyces acidiscabies TaxID=42234 RepID=UPI0038F76E17